MIFYAQIRTLGCNENMGIEFYIRFSLALLLLLMLLDSSEGSF